MGYVINAQDERLEGSCHDASLGASDVKLQSADSGLGIAGGVVPLTQIEYGVYGDFLELYPKPYPIYLWGTINAVGLIKGYFLMVSGIIPNSGESGGKEHGT